MSGWAAATGALNLATGERDPDVPDGVREILMRLKWQGNNGYPAPKRGTSYATMVPKYVGELKARGFADFVAGYLVGTGLRGERGEQLKTIYRTL